MTGAAYAVRMAVIFAAAVVFLGFSFLPIAAITSQGESWIVPGVLFHNSINHHSGFSEFIDGLFALVFCSGCMGSLILLSLLPAILTVVIAIWMYNDAKSRGDSNAVVWAILGLLFNVIGLVIYLVVRGSTPRPPVAPTGFAPVPPTPEPVQELPKSDTPPHV